MKFEKVRIWGEGKKEINLGVFGITFKGNSSFILLPYYSIILLGYIIITGGF